MYFYVVTYCEKAWAERRKKSSLWAKRLTKEKILSSSETMNLAQIQDEMLCYVNPIVLLSVTEYHGQQTSEITL